MNKISGREGGTGDGTAVHRKTGWRDPAYEWIDVRTHGDAEPRYVRGMKHREPVMYPGILGWQPATIAWESAADRSPPPPTGLDFTVDIP